MANETPACDYCRQVYQSHQPALWRVSGPDGQQSALCTGHTYVALLFGFMLYLPDRTEIVPVERVERLHVTEPAPKGEVS